MTRRINKVTRDKCVEWWTEKRMTNEWLVKERCLGKSGKECVDEYSLSVYLWVADCVDVT
jgi:hypothetical protein